MQYTTYYNMTKAEGTDLVNPLTQIFPNFDIIDGAMENNKNAAVGTATEVTTGTVHAITRANTNNPVFRFTATSAWAAGDTMTVDGVSVSVHLSDGQTPASGAYIIGTEVLAILNGGLVTLLVSAKEISRPYVEVTADGAKNNKTLLNELNAIVDRSKIGPESVLEFYDGGSSKYECKIFQNTTGASLMFSGALCYAPGSTVSIRTYRVHPTDSGLYIWDNGTISDYSTNTTPGAGAKYTIYY